VFERADILKLWELDPKPIWSSYEQVEEHLIHAWRTEPTTVEIFGDDLWLGVKGLSNLEIAGFPRNLFR